MFERLGTRGAIALSQLLIAGTVVVGGGVGVGLEQAGVFGGGEETVEVSLDAVSTFDCPDGGEVGEVHRGDRVLATGRDTGGDWIEIRDPRDLGARAWVSATYLVPDADLSGLDVSECEVLVAAPTTTTLLVPFPGPQPDGGGGGGGPAPPGDTTGPSISGPTSNRNPIWEFNTGGNPPTCNANPALFTTATVSASANDPSGVVSVTMSWQVGATSGSTPMSGSGSYSAALGPFPDTTISTTSAPINITITARDGAGNQRTASGSVTLNNCVFG
jgi:hypothetical protein